MDKFRRYRKIQSLFGNTKSIGEFALVLLLLTSCQSGQKKHTKIEIPQGYTPAQYQQITFSGYNTQPKFSLKADQIIFISEKRAKHLHTQVYTLNLSDRIIKRITYQDGINSTPIFTEDSRKILYSSSTDEIKERPSLLVKNVSKNAKENDKKNPNNGLKYIKISPSEIYSSHLNGSNIRRLTNNPNHDGHPSLHPKKNLLLFSSQSKDSIDLYTMSLQGQKRKQLTKTPDHEIQGQFSNDGSQMAWISFDKKFLSSHLVLANSKAQQIRHLKLGVFYVFDPSWHLSDRYILFTGNLHDYDNFELYVYDLEMECTKRLTYTSSNEMNPAFSPDGQRIVFASDLNEGSQLYIMPFLPPKSCVP